MITYLSLKLFAEMEQMFSWSLYPSERVREALNGNDELLNLRVRDDSCPDLAWYAVKVDLVAQ